MTPTRLIATDPSVAELLASDATVAVGVSGGKDSQAVALAVARHLDAIGHAGPRVLIHADLGRVEWRDSLPVCERLARHLGWELIVVHRAAGDMLDRWESRWVSRSEAYARLETVLLTLPWSTPALRFCTGEMKTDVIARELRRRFPTGPIVSVDGVRAQESSARARKPVTSPAAKLTRKGHVGVNWHAIFPWSIDDVFAEIADAGLKPHEAYRVHGASRVSCGFCIMGSLPDLTISARLAEHLDTYHAMVDLECRSTFSFQSNRWLGDVAPERLTEDLRVRLAAAKVATAARKAAEATIPDELLFGGLGWPSRMPTIGEADALAGARRSVAAAVGLNAQYLSGEAVLARYEELIAARDASSRAAA
ncbi:MULTISPECIES: phosphoadenosine phosphosulfate reductase domain-containing protein [unclassified Rhodanobacter]|uniref:phosphoadenosine phosphosulfate reductase domain-containing protein n=1 Tax=unclassified Rhodanobacter TaxID=2621553 RepID=UPI0007AA3422|nr:phosphoadenosine phosphosulfate reductase family protein [Rhodanobacter sp. FW510-R10]KZC32634.1 hypothetical protein RhoFW510R10_12020 [Rhodanobacter sp. FW510-R10]